MGKQESLVPTERIAAKILVIRGHKVLLDSDLAELYAVETKVLTRAVRRHRDRFPEDFMFQLTKEEFTILRSQIGASSSWGGRRYPPYAFTEQGVAMLSSILNSKTAIQVNIHIMRAFVRLRSLLASDAKLAQRLRNVEEQVSANSERIVAIVKLLSSPKKADYGDLVVVEGFAEADAKKAKKR